jgi:hypothetical protein
MNKNELVHLSFMKVVAMILVIFTHCIGFLDEPNMFWTEYHPEAPWDVMVYLNHTFFIWLVPAFIFVSGFLFAKSQETHHFPVFRQIGHRSKRLLIPWFCTTVFWLIPVVLIFDIPMHGRPADGGIWETYKAGLLGKCSFQLWYLQCLFWATLFWAFALWLIKRYRYWEILGWVLALAGMFFINNYCKEMMYWSFWESGSYILLMYFGIVVYKHRKKIDAFFYKRRILSIVLFAGCFGLTFLEPVIPQGYMAFVSAVFVFLFYGASLNIVRIWNKFFTNNKAFSFLNDNVMLYYLLHSPTTFVVFYLLVNKMHLNKYAFFMPEFLIVFMITTILIVAFSWLKRNIYGKTQFALKHEK